MKVAVIGATGMVGQTMLKVLAERNFPVTQLIPVASESSVGKEIEFSGNKTTVVSLEEAILMSPDLALFSAGGTLSLAYAKKFVESGSIVIDNSSAWRKDPTKKLVVPEVNGFVLEPGDKIIANPNCSTIQLVMVLASLQRLNKIKRIVVSTYQSVSGTGMKAIKQMENERNQVVGDMAYHYPIDMNCIPHCDVFMENGYSKEEMKLVNETQKILDEKIAVTATAVRVPVSGGHSEAVNIEFYSEPNLAQLRTALNDSPGVSIIDNTDVNQYPMPLYAEGKDDVFVGRIRTDESQPKTINLWIVSDNLRKGAATNAIQIAELMLEKKLLGSQCLEGKASL